MYTDGRQDWWVQREREIKVIYTSGLILHILVEVKGVEFLLNDIKRRKIKGCCMSFLSLL